MKNADSYRVKMGIDDQSFVSGFVRQISALSTTITNFIPIDILILLLISMYSVIVNLI
jgi:hypothetical protein